MKNTSFITLVHVDAYANYLGGNTSYGTVKYIGIKADTAVEAIETAKREYADYVVISKAQHLESQEELMARSEAEEKARRAKAEEAKARKVAREQEKAKTMGLTIEEYKAMVKREKKIAEAQKRIAELETELAKARAYLARL